MRVDADNIEHGMGPCGPVGIDVVGAEGGQFGRNGRTDILPQHQGHGAGKGQQPLAGQGHGQADGGRRRLHHEGQTGTHDDAQQQSAHRTGVELSKKVQERRIAFDGRKSKFHDCHPVKEQPESQNYLTNITGFLLLREVLHHHADGDGWQSQFGQRDAILHRYNASFSAG